MDVNRYIDHTLLNADATEKEIDRVVKEALDNHFFSVMINPYWVKHVHEQLKGTDVKTGCVIGFPLGANTTAIKVAESRQAIEDGVDELDMVMNIGEFKAGHDDKVLADIEAVVKVGHEAHKLVKVIIEACLLTDEEITRASKIAATAGADFVKTSTGFSKHGATVEAVQLMSRAVEGKIAVKAAGGIHSLEDANAMIQAGATRLGASASLKIIGKA